MWGMPSCVPGSLILDPTQCPQSWPHPCGWSEAQQGLAEEYHRGSSLQCLDGDRDIKLNESNMVSQLLKSKYAEEKGASEVEGGRIVDCGCPLPCTVGWAQEGYLQASRQGQLDRPTWLQLGARYPRVPRASVDRCYPNTECPSGSPEF